MHILLKAFCLLHLQPYLLQMRKNDINDFIVNFELSIWEKNKIRK